MNVSGQSYKKSFRNANKLLKKYKSLCKNYNYHNKQLDVSGKITYFELE